MQPVKTTLCNNEATGPGLEPLPLYEYGLDLGNKTIRVCNSYWKPNKEERKLLNKGGVIVLSAFGVQIPVKIEVAMLEIVKKKDQPDGGAV